MFRRISPFQLIFAVLVVALWGAVLFDRDARQLAYRHGRFAMGPRSFNFTLPFEPTERVDLQMVDAQENRDKKKFRALVEANPHDAALLAIYIRSNDMMPKAYLRRDGPLASVYPNWSVQVEPPPSRPREIIANLPQEKLQLVDTKGYLNLVARGRNLEPQNSYWDWMEMVALIEARRERELDAIAHRAARKLIFDDHTGEEMRARLAYLNRQKLAFEPNNTVMVVSAVLLPHLSAITNASRFLAQRVMGQRLEGHNKEALSLGLDGMRLARQIRLQATWPITSIVGGRCERMFIEKAQVRLGPVAPLPPATSPLSVLASSPTSLLYLARAKSPKAATEIATEWQRIGRWAVSSPLLFGGLVTRRTILGIGWTTRATSVLAASLPIAFLAWAILVGIGRKGTPAEMDFSPRLVYWGVGWSLLFFVAFLVCEWLAQVQSAEIEEWLVFYHSLLRNSRPVWGGVTLWLLWLALWRRPQPKSLSIASRQRIEDWEAPLAETLPLRLMEWAWNTLKWGIRVVLPMAIGMCFIGGICVTLLEWPDNSEDAAQKPLWDWEHLLWLFVLLAVLPTACVWLREIWHRKRKRERLGAPQIFVGRAQRLLSGYLLLALVALPLSVWAQSRYERDFKREVAPIIQGKMIPVMRKMRGLPMQ
ncbi:hypothetical protein EON83_25255 [bacterium]|nr:MAG: hypothetical protein EON83_25255 [bacterium]